MRLITISIFFLTSIFQLHCQWAEFPVEKYKFYKQTNKDDLRKFSGIGKLFITFQHKNIEFIGINYKDQLTVDEHGNWIEQNGSSSENPIFDLAFSNYEITNIVMVDSSYYKFQGHEVFSFRSIDGYLKLKKTGRISHIVVEFELSEYTLNGSSIFNLFKYPIDNLGQNILDQFTNIYFGNNEANGFPYQH